MAEKDIITVWFKEFGDEVYNFLIYYTGQTDVDDLVQEVFIKALRKIDSFREDSSQRTWLFSIARHVAIDELRKSRKEREKAVKAWGEEVVQNNPTPEEVLQFSERKKEIYAAIKTLKQNHHDVLILKGIKELSVSETAGVLGWSENKVRVTYHRAMKALEKKLGRDF